MRIAVALNADHTALYRVSMGGSDADFITAVAFWTLEGDVIHIHNRPTAARLVSTAAPTRDPAVDLSMVVTNADGTPAKGLGVTWKDAGGLYAMAYGRHSSVKGETSGASQALVMRVADRQVLQTIDLKKGGPNSFSFVYHPSDQEPFDIGAIALDAKAQVIEVEVGTSQVKLRRVDK